MKKTICTMIMIAGMCTTLASQTTVQYNYDDAGNRVKRWLTTSKQLVVPDTDKNKSVAEEIITLMFADLQAKQTEGIENTGKGEVRVFPNPVEEKLEIQTGNAFSNGYDVQLYDVSGKLYYSAKNNQGNIDVNMSSAPSGLYYLILMPKEGKWELWKLVKE